MVPFSTLIVIKSTNYDFEHILTSFLNFDCNHLNQIEWYMGSVAVVSVEEVYVDDEVGDIPNWWYDWKVGDVSRMFVSGQDGDIFITNSIINSGVSFTRATVFKLYYINYSQNWIECSLQNISTADYFFDHNRSQFYTICGNKCLFIGASQVQGISKILYFALRKVTYVQIRSW